MTMQELINELEAFRNKGGVVESVACEDPTLVLTAKQSLGLQFSPAFIAFHQTYKYLQIGCTEFIAIGHLSDTYQSKLRAKKLPSPNHFPILDDESGGYYYLLCAKAGTKPNDTCGSVIHFGPQTGEFQGHSDYFDFVRSVVRSWESFL